MFSTPEWVSSPHFRFPACLPVLYLGKTVSLSPPSSELVRHPCFWKHRLPLEPQLGDGNTSGTAQPGSSCRQRCAPSAATRARSGAKISPDTRISTWIKAPTKYLPTLRDPAALAELLGQEEGAGPAGNTTWHSQPAHNQSCLESLITEGFESVPWTNQYRKGWGITQGKQPFPRYLQRRKLVGNAEARIY